MDEDRTWNSCCLKSDRKALVFFSQLSVSAAVLAFSCFMLFYADGNCEKSSGHFSTVSFILGKLLSSVI